MNVNSRRFGVFGNYWVNPKQLAASDVEFADSPTLGRMERPRLDIAHGLNNDLYYRFLDGKGNSSSGEILKSQDGKRRTFSFAAGTPDEAEVVVDRYSPQDLPGEQIVSLPVGRNKGEQRVKLHISVGDTEEEFWLRILDAAVLPLPPESDQIHYFYADGRTVEIQWDYDKINLGFGIFLKHFEMTNEPGSRMASHYASLVDFIELNEEQKKVPLAHYSRDYQSYKDGEDVLISMNRPASFQGFRLYQSSYQGPYQPSDPRFFQIYGGKTFSWEEKPREEMFLSTFSINDDPGRGLKYLGCFLTVFGAALFMRRKVS
jgi:hypothetical protein